MRTDWGAIPFGSLLIKRKYISTFPQERCIRIQRSSLSPTKSASAARRAFDKPLAVEMGTGRNLIPPGFEFGSAFGANIGTRYDRNINYNEEQHYRNHHNIPRHINRSAKPVYLAGGEGERRAQGKEEKQDLFHERTFFLCD